jgi:hypothetical protein
MSAAVRSVNVIGTKRLRSVIFRFSSFQSGTNWMLYAIGVVRIVTMLNFALSPIIFAGTSNGSLSDSTVRTARLNDAPAVNAAPVKTCWLISDASAALMIPLAFTS